MKRMVLFSGIAVAVAAAVVTQGYVSMEYRITGAVGIYYMVLILLEDAWEISRDAILGIRKDRRRGYGRKKSYKAR